MTYILVDNKREVLYSTCVFKLILEHLKMLRKMIVGLSLLAMSFGSFATNWELLDDSADGNFRLLVNAGSLQFSDYSANNGQKRVMAGVAMSIIDVANSKEQVFTANIDVFECLEKNSGQLVIATSSSESKKYFWTPNGNKLYDIEGRWLCEATKIAYQKYIRNKEAGSLKPNM